MDSLKYEAPVSVEDAVNLLSSVNGNAKILAGGTDLLVQLRMGTIKPQLIINVKDIPELSAITYESGRYRVGAAVSGAALGEHEGMKAAWPGVVEALELIGSTQIQGRASMGGNLCNASPAADAVPAMIAAGAICSIAGSSGRRELPVEQVVIAPGQTSLAPDEFVVDFLFPEKGERSGDAYLRFIPRTEMDIAVVGVGINLSLDESGYCTTARVALGAVAATQVLVDEGANALIGSKLGSAALDGLDQAAQAACNPINDKRGTIKYRTTVAGVLARRAAEIARQRAEIG